MSERGALETRLKALDPTFPTAWENASYTPTTGTPYQQVTLMRATPENPVQGIGFREQGFLQVSLYYPLNKGPGDAEAKAKALRDWFPKKLSLVHGGITVTINAAAEIATGFKDGDRWVVPVRIPFHTKLQT